MRQGKHTPWGRADSEMTLAPGIIEVSTPSHGGVYVGPELNEKIPASLRDGSGWYEEDCQANIPYHFFYDDVLKYQERVGDERRVKWLRESREYLLQAIKDWFPTQYEEAYNTVLERGQSRLKDDYFFSRMDNVGKWERGATFGDWCYDVQKGMVYAEFRQVVAESADPNNITNKTGELLTGLIPQDACRERYYSREQIVPYVRDAAYYTWDDFTRKTGQQRYK